MHKKFPYLNLCIILEIIACIFFLQKVLTACKRLPECFENRGKTKQIEYGAYEVRCFSEMLLKGSVVILEV